MMKAQKTKVLIASQTEVELKSMMKGRKQMKTQFTKNFLSKLHLICSAISVPVQAVIQMQLAVLARTLYNKSCKVLQQTLDGVTLTGLSLSLPVLSATEADCKTILT
jgi:hypothetical protein